MESPDPESTSTLVRHLAEQLLRLARSEARLTRRDLRGAAHQASRSALLFGVGGVLGIASFVVLCVGTGMALSDSNARGTLITGSLLGSAAAMAAALGAVDLPLHPLDPTRKRLEADVKAAAGVH